MWGEEARAGIGRHRSRPVYPASRQEGVGGAGGGGGSGGATQGRGEELLVRR